MATTSISWLKSCANARKAIRPNPLIPKFSSVQLSVVVRGFVQAEKLKVSDVSTS